MDPGGSGSLFKQTRTDVLANPHVGKKYKIFVQLTVQMEISALEFTYEQPTGCSKPPGGIMKSKTVKGFKVELDLTESFGCSNDCGGKWALVCIEHGFIIQDTNKARLWNHANNVADWCEIHNDVEAK